MREFLLSNARRHQKLWRGKIISNKEQGISNIEGHIRSPSPRLASGWPFQGGMPALFFVCSSFVLRLFFVFSSSFLRLFFDKDGGGYCICGWEWVFWHVPPVTPEIAFMASVKGNVLTTGLSGKFAERIVFYQRAGKQFARKMPEPRQSNSQRQLSRQALFKEAVAYARQQRQDPGVVATLSARLEPGRSLYHALIGEFMRGGRILNIEQGMSNDEGNEGLGIGNWELGIGDWELGIGNWDVDRMDSDQRLADPCFLYAKDCSGNFPWILV
jgi:hypothetical protein